MDGEAEPIEPTPRRAPSRRRKPRTTARPAAAAQDRGGQYRGSARKTRPRIGRPRTARPRDPQGHAVRVVAGCSFGSPDTVRSVGTAVGRMPSFEPGTRRDRVVTALLLLVCDRPRRTGAAQAPPPQTAPSAWRSSTSSTSHGAAITRGDPTTAGTLRSTEMARRCKARARVRADRGESRCGTASALADSFGGRYESDAGSRPQPGRRRASTSVDTRTRATRRRPSRSGFPAGNPDARGRNYSRQIRSSRS